MTIALKENYEKGKEYDFTFNDIDCKVLYNSEQEKAYYLYIYNNGMITDIVNIFPSTKASKNQLLTAFHVANRFILPNMIFNKK